MSSSNFYDNLNIRPETQGKSPLDSMLNHLQEEQRQLRDDLDMALYRVEQHQEEFNVAAAANPHIQYNPQIANMNPFAPPINNLATHPVQGLANSHEELTNAINNAKQTLVYITLMKRQYEKFL